MLRRFLLVGMLKGQDVSSVSKVYHIDNRFFLVRISFRMKCYYPSMRFILPLSAAAVMSLVSFATPALATTGCNAEGWEQGWFSDVRGCHSYYPAIKYVQEEAIVEGYSDGTYRPESPINRAEFVKILFEVKFPNGTGDHCGASPKTKYFSDVDYLSAWYGDYVCSMVEFGYIDGYPDGTFRPGNMINYAEAAKIAANAYGLKIDTEDDSEWGSQDTWFLPYSIALLGKHAVPPTVDRYAHSLTRGEMAEMIYRLETGKTSFDWFARLPDGDTVTLYALLGDSDVEISYPGSVFAEEESSETIPDIYADGGMHSIRTTQLAYVRPDESDQGCDGMSGMLELCRPSKSDLVINVGIVDRAVEYLVLGMNWRDADDVTTVAGRPARSFWEGVECEGREFVFVPLDVTRSLAITRLFNCNDTANFARQEELFSAFLENIRFQNEYVPQTALTMQVSLLMCGYDAHNEPERNAPTVNIQRTVPRSSSVADMTLRALLNAGMNAEANMSPCEGVETLARMYRGVTIVNGVATVMLSQSFHAIFGENETASLSAQRSVTANLKQFPSVQSVRYVVVP